MKYIYLIGIMGDWVFFLILTLMGIEYKGFSDSKIYAYYWVTILLISLFITFIFVLPSLKRQMIPKKIVESFIILIIIIMLYMFSFYLYDVEENGNFRYAKVFASKCIPAFLIGVNCTLSKNEIKLIKTIVRFVIYGTPILIINMIRLLRVSPAVSSLDSLGGLGRL